MKKFILIIVVLYTWNSYAQYEGFYTKKNEVNVSMGMNFPSFSPFRFFLFNSYTSKYIKMKGDFLERGKNVMDLSFSVGYSHAIKRNFAVGFDALYERGNIGISPVFTDYNYKVQLFENFRTYSLTLIPKLIFATKNSLLPVGLSHQIGFGYSITKIQERDYAYGESNNSQIPKGSKLPVEDYHSIPINYSLVTKNIKFLYELNVKTPISKVVTINFGIRYNFSIPLGYSYKPTPNEDYPISNYEIYSDIRSMQWRKIASFNVGMSYLF